MHCNCVFFQQKVKALFRLRENDHINSFIYQIILATLVME